MQRARKQTASGESVASPSDATDTLSQAAAIVPIEDGRERRDRRGGKPQRLEKSDRKAIRRSNRPAVAPAAPGVVEVASAAAEPGSEPQIMAEQVGTEVPLEGTSGDSPAAADAAGTGGSMPVEMVVAAVAPVSTEPATLLVAPLVDTSSGQKVVERTRAQFHAAESAVETHPEVIAVIAPLIRHVNGVTEQLNEAQLNLGRVSAERDALRLHLAQVQGVDVSQLAIMPVAETGAASADRHGTRFQKVENRASEPTKPTAASKLKIKNPLGVGALATREEMARVARRRQLLAIALFGAVGLVLFMNSRQGNDISKVSRDSLADLQFVGVFFNVFFMVWMLYRVVRVGGKGAKWLFPQNTSSGHRRH